MEYDKMDGIYDLMAFDNDLESIFAELFERFLSKMW